MYTNSYKNKLNQLKLIKYKNLIIYLCYNFKTRNLNWHIYFNVILGNTKVVTITN